MKIRAMIIDESENSRQKLSEILESDHSIEVVCKLGDEDGAAEMVGWMSPDVVLIKVDICKKGGVEFFDSILKKKIPMIVIGNGKDRCDELIDLLEKGAVDFLAWPNNKPNSKDVIKKVKNASKARPLQLKERLSAIRVKFPDGTGLKKVVVIASSMGGPQAVRQIIPKMPKNFPAAIIIVQHMSKGFTESLAKSLDRISEITVKEAVDKESLAKGVAYIAPQGYHLYIEDAKILLRKGSPINGVIPSADCAMKSAAESYGPDSIGVVLTGMGKDGAKGIEEIKKAGGRTIAQDRNTSVVFGMPQAALMTRNIDKVVELERIPEVLIQEVSS